MTFLQKGLTGEEAMELGAGPFHRRREAEVAVCGREEAGSRRDGARAQEDEEAGSRRAACRRRRMPVAGFRWGGEGAPAEP